MSQRRTGSKFVIKNSSRSSSSRSSSASLTRNYFAKDYRECTPFSTTTAESSDDDNGIGRDITPTTPTTPTPPTLIAFKPNKQISSIFTSPQFSSPLVVIPQLPQQTP